MDLFGHVFHFAIERQRVRISRVSFEEGVIQGQGLVLLAG